MGRLAYGEVSRKKTSQLLEALLDLSNDHLDPDFSEQLRKKGLRCHQADWHTDSPKLDIQSTRPLLIELVQFRYQSQALIDSKPKLKEALDHLEQTVQCLRLRGKKQGQRIVDGTFTLWSTDTDANLREINERWPRSQDQSTDEQSGQTEANAEDCEAPQTDTPFSNTADTSDSSGSAESEDTWEDLFDQVVDLLRGSLPHSPLFRSAIRLLGIDLRARITAADRQYLLQRVQKMWLQDYLRNALSFSEQWQTLRIDITNQPSALAQYRNIVWENPQHLDTLHPLPASTNLIEQFNDIKPLRRLLILGAPGSGKTIALLELLRELHRGADSELTQPIPVVFNLSTYGLPPAGRNFTSWLVTQLEQQYSLDAARGRRFIEEQTLLLLLDGLDEVRSHLRNVCIRQINQFLRTYRHTECIVCSRIVEYETATDALQLEASLKLQPLTLNQATEYLGQFSQNQSLASLIQAIRSNSDFQQLAETPLMLNVMALAYQHKPTSELQSFTCLDDHRAYLYDAVLNRLLNRKQPVDRRLAPSQRYGDKAYSPEEIRAWLIWLAKRMVEHDQTTFFIEQLTPDWLDTRRQRQGFRLNSHLIVGILTGVISACHMTPMAGWQDTGEATRFFLPILRVGIFSSVLVSVLFIGLRRIIPQILAGFVTASVYVVLFGILAHPFMNLGPNKTYIARLSPILIDWLGMAFFWGLMRSQLVVIHKVTWSWLSALRFTGIGCLAYLVIYLPLRLFLLNEYHGDYWFEIAYEFFLIAALSATYGGFSLGSTPEPKDIVVPNQGMQKAIGNAVLLAIVMGPAGMLIAWQYAHGNPYEYAMIAGAIGLLAALLGGQRSGQVLIQHLIIRIILWWNRRAPWNYARFLNFVTRSMVLRRAGGGYLFMHRSFMEHLAKKSL
ncbi:NACHT domain-containing protein [Leptolyngbya cf. ectocarpi LEGE 11479]|uniref:NACHT domain-containing protein n=1 Tax=Leptolyngbya cf. ectocarpi LEGE 11479 TaxID=1828722 RepID=A0A928X1M1_LEPEC|nr:NACHT domain-containing protein [Leptolyngbya ectocarpi]MBE9066782.1 NACHT domain-containing protein [Leptolyngbya cf. ectocarpi LEGE 11479]